MQLADTAPASQVDGRRSGAKIYDVKLGAKIYDVKVFSTSVLRLRSSRRGTLTLASIALAPCYLGANNNGVKMRV
jgi:hypothetical protein